MLAEAAQYPVDLRDVRGQQGAKRALEVACAGSHNIIFLGPPGAGKTMLAKRIPTILPPMSLEEAIETTRVHSVAGILEDSRGLVGTRPFRSPHHTISDAGLIGGGAIPRPGEVSLGHNGVLFLDELPEFQRNVLEVMRQPLEEGSVTIARAALSVTFPARFMLAAAMNPCPCGFFGDPTRECHCTPPQIQRYVSKISGPLLDRMDIHIEVPAVKYKELRGESSAEDSAAVRQRVVAARQRQAERFAHEKRVYANAQMPPKLIRKHCAISADGEKLAGDGRDAPGTFRARPRPHPESLAHHRRSGCVGIRRIPPPQRGHSVPHLGSHLLGGLMTMPIDNSPAGYSQSIIDLPSCAMLPDTGGLPRFDRIMSTESRRIEVTMQTLLESVHLAEEISRSVAATLGFCDDDRDKISLAVREGVANAVYYGNQERPEKLVRLIFEVDADRFIVRILDQGPGFNLDDVPDPLAQENLLKTSGRGIFLMRAFMDEFDVLRSSAGGAELVMTKRLPPCGAERPPADGR